MNKRPKDYLKMLRGETKKDRLTLWITKSVSQDFKKVCEEIAPSRVVEAFMIDFINERKAEKNHNVLSLYDIDDLGLSPQNMEKLSDIKDKESLNKILKTALEGIINSEENGSARKKREGPDGA